MFGVKEFKVSGTGHKRLVTIIYIYGLGSWSARWTVITGRGIAIVIFTINIIINILPLFKIIVILGRVYKLYTLCIVNISFCYDLCKEILKKSST